VNTVPSLNLPWKVKGRPFMTQVLAALHRGGIAVATDSRAIRCDAKGTARILTVNKLFPLGTHAFVLSAGAGIGLPLSRGLQAFIQGPKAYLAEEILTLARPFLTHHYREFLSLGGGRPREDPLGRLFFLLGAKQCAHIGCPFRMILLASEGGLLPFEEHEVRHCLTIPRSLGAESRLHRMCLSLTALGEILKFAEDFLMRRAREDEGVGPPFRWALLTGEGLRTGQWIGKAQADLLD
jgi:hypothetical protein